VTLVLLFEQLQNDSPIEGTTPCLEMNFFMQTASLAASSHATMYYFIKQFKYDKETKYFIIKARIDYMIV